MVSTTSFSLCKENKHIFKFLLAVVGWVININVGIGSTHQSGHHSIHHSCTHLNFFGLLACFFFNSTSSMISIMIYIVFASIFFRNFCILRFFRDKIYLSILTVASFLLWNLSDSPSNYTQFWQNMHTNQ